MGKRGKNKKPSKGAAKILKNEVKLAAKQKKMLLRLNEREIEEIIKDAEAAQLTITKFENELCCPPTPRSNFSLLAHPTLPELILFGGELYNGKKVEVFNDMFVYNVDTKLWRKYIAPRGPTPRSSHQMVVVPNETNGELWLFGGEHPSPSQLQFYHYRDLWSFNLSTFNWEKIDAPNAPSARSGHRMVLMNGRLVVFGGFYDNYNKYEYYNDLHMFDLSTRQWLSIKTVSSVLPTPRAGCCMVAVPDGRVLIWGGYAKRATSKRIERGQAYSDMFTLSPQFLSINYEEHENWQWSAVRTNGVKLLPLSGVSCAIRNFDVYTYGGVLDVDEDDDDVQGDFKKELLHLNLKSLTWTKCVINKKPASLNSSKFLLNCRYSETPTPRMNAGLCILRDTLYLYGGLIEDENCIFSLNDFYSLNLNEMNEWKAIIPTDQNPHEWIDSDDSVDEDEDENDDDDEDDSENSDDNESEDDNKKESMDID